MAKQSKAFAPASLSNLNCGFDTLGLAIDSLGDEVTVIESDTEDSFISQIENGEGLPSGIEDNICGKVVTEMLRKAGYQQGVEVKIKKGFKWGSGLGSSAASASAAAVACNDFLGNRFSTDQLLDFALHGEYLASKSWHGDNVLPSVLGGIVLVRSVNPISYVKLPVPDNLHVVVLFPDIEIKTSEARDLLGNEVPLKRAIKQWANLGSLVAAFYRSDFDLMREAMHDEIIEQQRAHLIPHFYQIKEQALRSEAISFGITGSGPSMFAFSDSESNALKLQKKLEAYCKNLFNRVDSYVSKVNTTGATLIQ